LDAPDTILYGFFFIGGFSLLCFSTRLIPQPVGRESPPTFNYAWDSLQRAASSAESVGAFWFGQVAKCVIQSDFQCPGGGMRRWDEGDLWEFGADSRRRP